MNGSTETKRFQAAQVGAAIDQSGNIVIHKGGHVVLGFTPCQAAAFAAGLCQLVSKHPMLNPPEVPQIVIAGTVPPFHLKGK